MTCRPACVRARPQLDATLLSPDDVHMLKLYVPTEEEIKTLRAYDGPTASLGIAERYFLEMLDVPRYEERLTCFEYLHGFDDKDAEVSASLETLSACFLELQNCRGFHQVTQREQNKPQQRAGQRERARQTTTQRDWGGGIRARATHTGGGARCSRQG
jgi:hypothetical protein